VTHLPPPVTSPTPMNPLVKPTAETSPTMQDFPPPLSLKHRPIFMMPYAPFDGPYANQTDAKFLSVGHAQWRTESDSDAVSAKVWRHSGDKWSRMSEELPLHRLVDLCVFLAKAFYQNGATRNFGPAVVIQSGTFENQTQEIELRRLETVPEGFEVENERVKARLRKLRDELQAANLD
jgi:Family of unknown function (DUF6530)